MEAGAVVLEKLANNGRRIDSVGRDLREVRDKTMKNSTAIEVQKTEVHDIKEDVIRLAALIEKEGERSRQAINRGVWALVGFALTAAGSAITMAMTIGHP